MRTSALSRALMVAFAALPTLAHAINDDEVNRVLQFNFSNPGARSLGLGGAFTGLADDATAQTESFALFILHYLSVTPAPPETMRAGAEALGRKRFEEFVSEVASRLLGRDRFADALLARIDLVRSEDGDDEQESLEVEKSSSGEAVLTELNGSASASRASRTEARS